MKALIYAGPGVGTGRGDTVEALESRAVAAGFEVRRLIYRRPLFRENWLETEEDSPVRFGPELLDSVDLLLMPGAGGEWTLFGKSNLAVGRVFENHDYDPVLRQAVENGLGYVGICAGALFAANPGKNDLDLGDFSVVWARNSGSGKAVMKGADLPDGTKAPELKVPLIGGPRFVLSEFPPNSRVREVATMEVNGEFVGTAAVTFEVGKGKVFLCGPHPEAIAGDPEWDGGDKTWRDDPSSVKNNYAFLEAWIRAVARR